MRRNWFWLLQPLVFIALCFLASVALYPTAEKIHAVATGLETGARWYDWGSLAILLADVLLYALFRYSNRKCRAPVG